MYATKYKSIRVKCTRFFTKHERYRTSNSSQDGTGAEQMSATQSLLQCKENEASVVAVTESKKKELPTTLMLAPNSFCSYIIAGLSIYFQSTNTNEYTTVCR